MGRHVDTIVYFSVRKRRNVVILTRTASVVARNNVNAALRESEMESEVSFVNAPPTQCGPPELAA